MTNCKLFTGKFNNKGYGYIPHADGIHLAHRLAWMLHNGSAIPKGMVVMHSCDNTKCIEPKHLILGTSKENRDDMLAKGRGRVGNVGRPAKITKDIIENIDAILCDAITLKRACEIWNISRAQYYNLKRRKGW